MRLHDGLRFFHVGDAERNVVHHPGELQVHVLGLVQHVLQPVGAVGNLQGDPVGLGVFHSAVPVGAEAEEVAVEVVFGIAVVHDEAGVDHVARHGRGCGWGDVGGASLDELDAVALGIVDREVEAVVGTALNLRNLDALRDQIFSQRADVVGGEGDVIHAVGGLGIGRGTVADPLGADHVSQCTAAVGWLEGQGWGEAEHVTVEFLHAVGRGGVERHVVNA